MKIIGRPVQGIDDPPPRGSFSFERALFCQNIMIRESVRNHFDDGPFALPVYFRDWIEFSFVLNRMGMTEMEHLDPTRLLGCGDG